MCRFIAYKGEEVTLNDIVISPTNSLIEQSKDAKKRKKPLNGDGFGLSWYPTHNDPFPARFVSIEPAWSNQNLQQIASKVRSQCFLPMFVTHLLVCLSRKQIATHSIIKNTPLCIMAASTNSQNLGAIYLINYQIVRLI